jgi:hypothetical protein
MPYLANIKKQDGEKEVPNQLNGKNASLGTPHSGATPSQIDTNTPQIRKDSEMSTSALPPGGSLTLKIVAGKLLRDTEFIG